MGEGEYVTLCTRSARLLPGLALAAFVLAAPAAQAYTCGPTEEVLTANNIFQDCSGTTNFVGPDFSTLEHDSDLDGGFVPDGYFTDLHITFVDSPVTVASGFFDNREVQTAWGVMISPDMKSIWFTAPDFNSRVIGGQSADDYEWFVDIEGASGLNELRVQIEYTMDVPEPSAALLLTPAFLGLVGLAAARRRRLH
jgi:hypothetical protein